MPSIEAETTEPDESDYVTQVDVSMAILREIAKLKFKERLPRIMAGVARQLVDAGVDFSHAVIPENLTITDEEWDAIYEDLTSPAARTRGARERRLLKDGNMKLYGIWCKDLNNNKGGWYRELPSRVDDGGIAILAFTSQREAKQRAAQEYGFDTYGEARKNDWCEVRPLAIH